MENSEHPLKNDEAREFFEKAAKDINEIQRATCDYLRNQSEYFEYAVEYKETRDAPKFKAEASLRVHLDCADNLMIEIEDYLKAIKEEIANDPFEYNE